MDYRICILGNSGSGKSTLAKALGARLNLPVFHLDREFLRGNYESIPESDRIKKHKELIDKPNWVIDGNYSKLLLDDRAKKANLVIYLNVSRIKTIPRVLLRSKTKGQDRETIPKDAKPGALSREFLKWTITYNRRKHLKLIQKLCNQEGADLLVLKNKTINDMVSLVIKHLK